MTQAVLASIFVLLLIAAICIIVLVVRSGNAKRSRISLGDEHASASGAPAGTQSMGGATAESNKGISRRFFIFFGLVCAAIGALFVRLWSMQLVSGKEYSAQAESNRITEYKTAAARGRIYDRNGKELVVNRLSFAVLVNSEVQNNEGVLQRLSNVLGIPRQTIDKLAASESEGAQADRLVALDVADRTVAYISEHPSAFPGVQVEARTVRSYPMGSLAAHVLGYTGTISQAELKNQSTGITYENGDTVGKDGVEQAFENYLQGDHGVKRVEINAVGEVVSQLDTVDPVQGNDIRLTIDADIQAVAENALEQAFEDAHSNGYLNAQSGALICMDCTNGEIIAMASAPTFDPSEFIGGVSTETWESLTDEESGYPLSNRCIAGQFPAASTFKGFTGLAGLQHGYASDGSVWNCEGTWTGFGEAWPQKCWNVYGHGNIGFHMGIVESCDVVFYEIAKRFYQENSTGTVLQDYLNSWGFGSKTGIELPGEAAGRVPTPQWKKEYNRDAPENQAWQPGDVSNLIIGQGDLLVSPLQIACGYAGLATGRIPKPVLLHSVVSNDGKTNVVEGSQFQGSNFTPEFTQENIEIMRSGFRDVVADGSVKKVFSGMATATSGKTGTGEVAGKDNMGWYVGFGPNDNPKYVCVCCIEEGGSGGSCAAPAVRQVLSAVFGEEVKHIFVESTRER